MSRLPAITATPEHDEGLADAQVDRGLFSAGGPFESFPGAVLVVGHNGIVLGANGLADPISQLLQGGSSAQLRNAVNAALEGKAAQITPLLIDAPDGQEGSSQAFDLLALPWAEAPAALLLGRDITLERGLRAALVESRQRYKDLVDAACDFAWETDVDGRFSFISTEQALGYPASELIGRAASELLALGEASEASPFVTREPLANSDVWLRSSKGATACFTFVVLPLSDEDGVFCGVRGQCRDVTLERTQASDLMRACRRERLFAHVLRDLRDGCEPRQCLDSIAKLLMPALSASAVVILRIDDKGFAETIVSAGVTLPQDKLSRIAERLAAGKAEGVTAEDEQNLMVVETVHRDRRNGALCIWYELRPWEIEESERFLVVEMAEEIAWLIDLLSQGETMTSGAL